MPTLLEGQKVKLPDAWPKNARNFSLPALVKFCLEPHPGDDKNGKKLEERKHNCNSMLACLKSEATYQQWFIHIKKLADKNKISEQQFKDLLHAGCLHSSEFIVVKK